ncbi:hypothetical protein MEO42_27200, partial [Dolichospermum sp. ST_sed6]|nr:hypothetical protein [Dolichospermum sp. ST_sed6]
TSIVGNVFLLLNPKYYIILGLDRMAALSLTLHKPLFLYESSSTPHKNTSPVHSQHGHSCQQT